MINKVESEMLTTTALAYAKKEYLSAEVYDFMFAMSRRERVAVPEEMIRKGQMNGANTNGLIVMTSTEARARVINFMKFRED